MRVDILDEIFYNRDLPPRSVLFYIYIVERCDTFSFCLIKFSDFTRRFNVVKSCVSRLLHELEDFGYIKLERKENEDCWMVTI